MLFLKSNKEVLDFESPKFSLIYKKDSNLKDSASLTNTFFTSAVSDTCITSGLRGAHLIGGVEPRHDAAVGVPALFNVNTSDLNRFESNGVTVVDVVVLQAPAADCQRLADGEFVDVALEANDADVVAEDRRRRQSDQT
jgi:hypothetical protein